MSSTRSNRGIFEKKRKGQNSLVRHSNRRILDTSNEGNLLCALGNSPQTSSEEDARSSDSDGTPSVENPFLRSSNDDMNGSPLDGDSQSEMVTVPSDEGVGGGVRHGSLSRKGRFEGLFEHFKALSDGLNQGVVGQSSLSDGTLTRKLAFLGTLVNATISLKVLETLP